MRRGSFLSPPALSVSLFWLADVRLESLTTYTNTIYCFKDIAMRKSHVCSLGWAMSALLIALVLKTSRTAASEPALQAGDEAVVNSNVTPLKIGEKTLGTLGRGERFKIIEVQGPWLGARVTVDGIERLGWIWRDSVTTPGQFAAQPRRVRRFSYAPAETMARPRPTYSRRGSSSSSSSKSFIMGATPYGPSYWRADRKIMGY